MPQTGTRALSRRVICAALSVLLTLSIAGPVMASPEQQRLQQARERLSDVRSELAKAREARDAEARALEVAEERVEEVLATVGEAELAVERQEEAVARAERTLEGLVEDIAAHEQRTADRIVELYRNGGTRPLTGLLSARSPGEAIARSVLLDVVNRADREAFEGIAASRQVADAQAERLEEERRNLEQLLEEQRRLLAEVEELREDKAIALAEQERKLGRLQSHEAHLASESRQLSMAAQRAAPARAEGPRTARGSAPSQDTTPSTTSGGAWRWPASGSITSEYGMRWGRLHAGIDIASGGGTPVVAARGGTVSFAGRMGGYGNLVLVSHGGGVVTAYAHLSSIQAGVGTSVGAGQRIGAMGCTGSCTGTHLHFEVRVNGNPRNPRNYLP